MKHQKVMQFAIFVVVLLFLLLIATLVMAQSPDDNADIDAFTSKILSTNFTLINFGSQAATVTANYFKTDGSEWTEVSGANKTFVVNPDGGQVIFRQYDPAQFLNLDDGDGSVVIQSDRELASVVQIQAIATQGSVTQAPSSGAYSAIAQGSPFVYVPLVSRQGVAADGIANSLIVIQNASPGPVLANVDFIDFFNGAVEYTKDNIVLPTGSSFYYDLDTETNLPGNFFGSAVVRTIDGGGTFVPDGRVTVVSNLHLGDDQMQTFNGFSQASVGAEWVAPLVAARLGNNLSTPVTVQNLSGGTLPPGAIRLNCVPDVASPVQQTLSISTPMSVNNFGAIAFNPVDINNFAYNQFPDGWYGSCRVSADADVVAFVQMRVVGSGNAAAYEAIPANSAATRVLVPLIAKRLTNGFATALTVQNLSATESTDVTLTYVPSPDYVAGGGSSDIITVTGQIPPDGSFIQNHRIVGGPGSVPELVDAWYGTVVVESTGQPIQAFVQLTSIFESNGDTLMAHNAFTP